MVSSKATKRALILSALSILMCAAMLAGTTFAWFTDTASTGVNKITSGNLHVEIQNKAGAKIEKLEWVREDGTPIADQDAILWEPGCTYLLTPFKIVNTGSLALKYKIVIAGLDGNSPLLQVIKFTYHTEDGKEFDIGAEGYLTAAGSDGAQTQLITVSAHMDSAAGNDYQEKELKNVTFTVYATQHTLESDSYDDQYDKDAEYDEEKVITVGDAAELTAAVKAAEGGETIRLGGDIAVGSTIFVNNKKLTLDLAGFRLSGTTQYTLQLGAGAEVTVSDSSDGATGVITNTYSGSATPAATVDLKGLDAVFTLESGTVQSNAKDNLYTLAIGNSNKTACTVNINGGTVSNPEGHVKSRAISASNGMTVNINGGVVSGGVYALDAYAGSVSNINGGKLFANGTVARNDEYGTSYAIHAKGEARISIGSAGAATSPNVKGIKFESSGVNTELPTINLVKGEITNPIYSLEKSYNYSLFKLGITADAPVTFTDSTASFFLADDLQMVQIGNLWKVTAK